MKFAGVIATVALATTNVNGVQPLVNISFLLNAYKEIQAYDLNTALELAISADNAAKGVHKTIHEAGGTEKFIGKFDDLMTVYYEQVYATLITGDVANEKMLNTSAMVKEAFGLGAQIVSDDYFNFVHGDVLEPITDAVRRMALPFNKSVVAIADLLGNTTIIYEKNKGKSRRLRNKQDQLVGEDRYEYATVASVKADICSTEPYLNELVEIGRSAMEESRIPALEFFKKQASAYSSLAPKMITPLTNFLDTYVAMIKAGNVSATLDTIEMAGEMLHGFCYGDESLQHLRGAAAGLNVSALVEKAITTYNSTIYMLNGTLAQIPVFDSSDKSLLGTAMKSMFPETASKGWKVDPEAINQKFIAAYYALGDQVVVLRKIVKPFLDGEKTFVDDITALGNDIQALMNVFL